MKSKVFQRITIAAIVLALVLAFSLVFLREARGEGEAVKEGKVVFMGAIPPLDPNAVELNYEIYKLDLLGGVPINITNDPAWDLWPTWSPDGKKIAFFSNRAGGKRMLLFTMNEDGSNLKNLGVEGMVPSWSPDGRAIAFFNSAGTINLILSEGTGFRQLMKGDLEIFMHGALSWTPDSKKLFFTDGSKLMFIDVLTGVPHVFLADKGSYSSPQVSPDGRNLIFGKEGALGGFIFKSDITGENQSKIYGGKMFSPSGLIWTADGKIFFTSREKWHLLESDGTNMRTAFIFNFEGFIAVSQVNLFGIVPENPIKNSPPDPPMSVSPQGKLFTTWGAIKSPKQ